MIGICGGKVGSKADSFRRIQLENQSEVIND